MKKIIILTLLLFISLPITLFATTTGSKNYKLELKEGSDSLVTGGFCDAKYNSQPLNWNDSITTIDGIVLTGKSVTEENVTYYDFTGTATIAIQINSLIDVKINLTGTPFTKETINQQSITVNGTESTLTNLSEIKIEIPDNNNVIYCEYLLMEVFLRYESDKLDTVEKRQNILSDVMTLRLEYITGE